MEAQDGESPAQGDLAGSCGGERCESHLCLKSGFSLHIEVCPVAAQRAAGMAVSGSCAQLHAPSLLIDGSSCSPDLREAGDGPATGLEKLHGEVGLQAIA